MQCLHVIHYRCRTPLLFKTWCYLNARGELTMAHLGSSGEDPRTGLTPNAHRRKGAKIIDSIVNRVRRPQDDGRGDLPEIHVTRNGSFFMKGRELAQSKTWRERLKSMVDADLARPNRSKQSLKRRSRLQGRPRNSPRK